MAFQETCGVGREMNRDAFACQCGNNCGYTLRNNTIWVLESVERDLQRETKSDYELKITSGARCPEHNERVGGSKNSAHVLGLAADISYENNRIKFWMLRSLFFSYVKRLGLNERLAFLHFDLATGGVPNPTDNLREYPQEVFFEYR